MAHISEVTPVIIDPGHERYGQAGEITFSGQIADGTYGIRFEDGEEVCVNDGWVTGIPQFVQFMKATEAEKVELLQNALPELRSQLAELFGQVEPHSYPPTEKTAAARKGAIALINSVIGPENQSGE